MAFALTQNTTLVWCLFTLILVYKMLKMHLELEEMREGSNTRGLENLVDVLENRVEEMSKTNDDKDKLHEKICQQKLTESKQGASKEVQAGEKLEDMMYRHPEFPLVRGRPFSGLETYKHILEEYLKIVSIKANVEVVKNVAQII